MGRRASRQSCPSLWKVPLSSSWPEAVLGGGTGCAAGALCAAWSLLGAVLVLPGFFVVLLSGTAGVRCCAPPPSRVTICPRHHRSALSICPTCISGAPKPSSSSSLLRGHSLWCPQTGCRNHGPVAGICSALSALAEFVPEQPCVWEPTWSCRWRALDLRHPLRLRHGVEDLLSTSSSSLLSGGSL